MLIAIDFDFQFRIILIADVMVGGSQCREHCQVSQLAERLPTAWVILFPSASRACHFSAWRQGICAVSATEFYSQNSDEKIRIKSMEHFKTKWFNNWITYSWWCITVVLSSRTYLPHTSQPCDSSRPDHVGCTAGINYRHWESETFSSSIKTSHNYEYYLIILMLLMYYASVCVYATNQSLV